MEVGIQISKQSSKNRCDIEIVAAILRATSQNGGMMITNLRERANLSWASLTRYVSFMSRNGLLREEISEDGNLHFAKVYRPSEKGFEFLIAYSELMQTLQIGSSLELN
ncbi:MAG: hypothetical protein JRN15_23220 [Nitrososphaerota archaeon]|nr:hypothetical protein [Nitrososphaerota archaeon]